MTVHVSIGSIQPWKLLLLKNFLPLTKKKALFLCRVVFLQDYGSNSQGVTRNTLNKEKYCKFDLPAHSKEHSKIISKLRVLSLFGNVELPVSSASLAEDTVLALEANRPGSAQTKLLYTESPQSTYGTDWLNQLGCSFHWQTHSWDCRGPWCPWWGNPASISKRFYFRGK